MHMDTTHAELIVTALERIADALEARKPRERTQFIASKPVEDFLAMMEASRQKLRGKMTAFDVAMAIGAIITPTDRTAFGLALTQFGAKKGRTGRARYYVFD